MKTTYDEYLKSTKSLSFEKMKEIHKQILDEIKGDDDAQELYEELIETSTRYTKFRSEWFLMDKEEKEIRDPSRSSCHNMLIINFNVLARYLKKQGKKVMWRDELGYEENDKYYRKTIGDFACYLIFINSLNAR